MNSDEILWEAILDVTNDNLRMAVRNGQDKKAEKLRKLVRILCSVPEDKR